MNTRYISKHVTSVIIALMMLCLPAAVWCLEKKSSDSSFVDSSVESVKQERTGNLTADYQRLMEKAVGEDRVPVIVKLRHEDPPKLSTDRISLAMHQQSLSAIQDRVVSRINAARNISGTIQGLKRFRYTPAIALHATPEELETLIQSPDVVEISEDKAVPPTLRESVPLIGADGSWSFNGYTGQGQVVAILDTGVDKTHPFLSGKVVSEACYSTNMGGSSTSLCPGGYDSSTAIGSGVDCTTSIDGCGHGTHVAGIAAGSGDSFTGVASDADIIAIQIFSSFSGSDCTDSGLTSPCALSWDSDQMRGLERIYDIRNSFNIASVNMSLGGGEYNSPCDNDDKKLLIDLLKAAGTATIISSGNGGYVDALGAPACISTAVSVGSSTKTDTVSYFSNSAYFLDILAPGSDIYSSTKGGGFESWNGTSMAAPHVTGAWAVLKQANPDAEVDDILNILTATGKSIADNRAGAGGRIIPRIQLDEATANILTNLTPYQPYGWSDKIVVSTSQETNIDSEVIFETDTIYVDWAIINDSDIDADEFKIALYIDNTLETTWDSDLEADYYLYLTDYDIGSLPAGQHSLKIIADSQDSVSESNETDNEYTKDFVVTQSCTYSISPSSGNFTSTGGTETVSVTASGSSCSWTTSESLSWVTLSPISGTGSGDVTVSVATNTGAARSGAITIADQTYNISQVAGVLTTTTVILTNSSPDHTVQAGSQATVYGTSSSNQIVLESGAQAKLINFPGFNIIEFQSDSDFFTVSRSGTIVTFEGSDGTVLKIPATLSVQTVGFTDRPSLTLSIHNGQVMLDDQVITTTPASIEGSQANLTFDDACATRLWVS